MTTAPPAETAEVVAPGDVPAVPGPVVGRWRSAGGRSLKRVALVGVLLAGLVALWEGYKALGTATGGTWPFTSVGLPVRPDDTAMPHVWSMVGALFEPARRGGEDVLLVLLLHDAWFTFREALVGFLGGTALGLALAVVFLKSPLLQRGLMPYVVVSQTVPLIAIAPMVVIWTGRNGWPGWVGVAIISGYLTFFPVAVNTLRGLTSPAATSLELMRSYAASDTQVLLRLRLPAALPYLFTALRVGATASVVGALVGELPAGLGGGLGRALLTFTQYYVTGPEKLYAAVLVTATLGLAFAGAVGLVERLVLRSRPGEAPA